MSDHFLTTDEAAAALRIHRTQLYRLVQTGEMPKPVKLGRSSRYLKSEIEQFMLDLRRKQDAANLTTKNETSRAILNRSVIGGQGAVFQNFAPPRIFGVKAGFNF